MKIDAVRIVNDFIDYSKEISERVIFDMQTPPLLKSRTKYNIGKQSRAILEDIKKWLMEYDINIIIDEYDEDVEEKLKEILNKYFIKDDELDNLLMLLVIIYVINMNIIKINNNYLITKKNYDKLGFKLGKNKPNVLVLDCLFKKLYDLCKNNDILKIIYNHFLKIKNDNYELPEEICIECGKIIIPAEYKMHINHCENCLSESNVRHNENKYKTLGYVYNQLKEYTKYLLEVCDDHETEHFPSKNEINKIISIINNNNMSTCKRKYASVLNDFYTKYFYLYDGLDCSSKIHDLL